MRFEKLNVVLGLHAYWTPTPPSLNILQLSVFNTKTTTFAVLPNRLHTLSLKNLLRKLYAIMGKLLQGDDRRGRRKEPREAEIKNSYSSGMKEGR